MARTHLAMWVIPTTPGVTVHLPDGTIRYHLSPAEVLEVVSEWLRAHVPEQPQ